MPVVFSAAEYTYGITASFMLKEKIRVIPIYFAAAPAEQPEGQEEHA